MPGAGRQSRHLVVLYRRSLRGIDSLPLGEIHHSQKVEASQNIVHEYHLRSQ